MKTQLLLPFESYLSGSIIYFFCNGCEGIGLLFERSAVLEEQI